MMINESMALAFKYHEGQFRKYNKVPFVIHPLRVAFKIRSFASQVEICAAILHDTVEDTSITHEEISNISPYILQIVLELTNPSKNHKDKPRFVRKKMDREHLRTCSDSAKLIKLADRIDNLNDMKEAPQDFKSLYCKESLELLECLKGTNKDLEDELVAVVGELNAI